MKLATGTARKPITLRSVPRAGTVSVNGHTISGVAVLTAGEAIGHGFKIDGVTLRQCADAINAAGRLKARLTHPEQDDLPAIVGYVTNARIDGSTVRATLTLLDSSPHAPFILELAQTIPDQFGLSIEADEFHFEKSGAGEALRISRLTAVDFVGRPAANGRGLLSEKVSKKMKELITYLQSLGMPAEIKDEAEILAWLKGKFGDSESEPAGGDVAMSAGGLATLTTAAIKDERARCQAMRGLASGMKLSADYADRWINDGLTLAEAGQAAVQLRARLDAASTPMLGNGKNFATPRREAANSEAALTAASLIHLGRKDLAEKHYKAAMPQALRLNCNTALDLCASAVRLDGNDAPGDSPNKLIRLAFSTSSLPDALGGSIDRIVADAYGAAPQTFRSWVGVKPAKSFREHTAVRLNTGNSELAKVPPGGEIPHGTLSDATYTFKVDTYARMLAITRQDIVNDDLGVLNDLAQALATEAPRSVSDLLYGLLLDNTGSFFGLGNSNFNDGADSVLGITSLSAAISAMRKVKDDKGRLIGLVPKIMLVPPELEEVALTIINSTEVMRDQSADMQGTANPWKGRLTLEVEPRLSDTDFNANASATAWYIFAGPANPCLVVSYLNGNEMPTVETSDAEFNTLGTQIRGYLDHGSAQADFRTGYMSAGV